MIPVMASVQFVCAKRSMVSGRGLAGSCGNTARAGFSIRSSSSRTAPTDAPSVSSAGSQRFSCSHRPPVCFRYRETGYFVFLRGTFAPFLRASESPIAIACLRLLTFLRLFPPEKDRATRGCEGRPDGGDGEISFVGRRSGGGKRGEPGRRGAWHRRPSGPAVGWPSARIVCLRDPPIAARRLP